MPHPVKAVLKNPDPQDDEKSCIAGARYEQRRDDEADTFCLALLIPAGLLALIALILQLIHP